MCVRQEAHNSRKCSRAVAVRKNIEKKNKKQVGRHCRYESAKNSEKREREHAVAEFKEKEDEKNYISRLYG